MPPLWKTICQCLKALQIGILLAFPFLGGTQTGLSAHIYIYCHKTYKNDNLFIIRRLVTYSRSILGNAMHPLKK